MELLAPAKNVESGKIAINCGADAVYIGGPQFSARSDAHNSVSDIARLVEYAHRYLCKVYVAMNTLLLNENEVTAAVRLIHTLYDAGIDGVIVQDMGLLEVGLPPMPIIASTQMHNHTPERVRFLERVGFQRAILPRELGIDEIAAIRNATGDIALEAFVHGALCVSYSGRCYLSAAIGGRSANRGECAQPCRKKYRLETSNGVRLAEGHLLSVNDLCRINQLDALIDAGVTSFKIEGRLKNHAYVANVVSAYRIALDKILNRRGLTSSADIFTNRQTPNLSKTFHRGYVSGFAGGNDKMANFTTPKMTGERLGEVSNISRNRILIKNADMNDLCPGDGLCFFSGTTLKGTRIQKINATGIILRDAQGISKGTVIYRNRDHQFLSDIEKQHPTRHSPIHITLEGDDNQMALQITDSNHLSHTAFMNGPFAPAQHVDRMMSNYRKQLCKTGDTEFKVINIDIHLNPVPFLQISAVNDLRRAALLQLRKQRAQHMTAVRLNNASTIAPFPCDKTIDKYNNISNHFARRFFQRCSAKAIAEGVEASGVFTQTELMRSRYCLRRELGICHSQTGQDALYLTDVSIPHLKFPLRFDCEKCEMIVKYEKTSQSKN